ncbi:MAG: type IV pili methyl-accepting chemotaxis transducer N-terminal domain-containing protein [Chloroflexi bacterium]|nr:type IV pili methyl-accepting chemotaxis transducer N-terminal domain-containing protein [Chloroflexota bacterium]
MNLRFITGSIQAKLIAVLLIMFGILAATIGLNFQTFGSLDGSTPMVNQAGAQRMRAYKAATLANEYFQADAEGRKEIGPALTGVITQFEEVQIGLASGDAKYDLNGTNSADVLAQLEVVDAEWDIYKSELQTILDSDTVAVTAIGNINSTVPALFSKAADVVGLMSTSQISVTNLDQAGAQRMRVFKLGFLANAWVTEVSEREHLALDIENTLSDFSAVQAGLRGGDADRNLSGTTSAEVLDLLTSVDSAFADLAGNITHIVNGLDVEGSSLKNVDRLTPSVFSASAAVVNSLNTNQVSVTDMDAAGGQRMRAYRTAYLANNYLAATTEAERKAIWAEIETQADSFEAIQAGLHAGDSVLDLKGTTSPAVLAALDATDAAWDEYRSQVNLVSTFDTGAKDAIVDIGVNVGPLFDATNVTTGLVADESQAVVGSLKTLELILLAVGALVLGLIVVFIRKTIVAKLREVTAIANIVSTEALPTMTDRLKSVAAGDLTNQYTVSIEPVTVSSSDEVGQIGAAFNDIISRLNESADSYNSMVENMSVLIDGVRETADSVNEAATEMAEAAEQAGEATQGIASTSQQVASGAQEQAAGIQSSVELINDLTAGLDKINAGSVEQTESVEKAKIIVGDVASATDTVASNAAEATAGSKAANEAADNGLAIVKQTVEGMERISGAVNSVSEQVTGLGEQSAEIGKIVAVIDDIAAQTNLLALNAAIEAARAGEQGRGFAVVADEVRQLAERVTGATSEIAGLIEGVQKGVQQSIKATEAGSQEVEQGSDLAKQAGEALETIIDSVAAVSDQIDAMAKSAQDVKSLSDQMVSNVESVESVANRNATSAAEMGENANKVRAAMDSVAATTEESSASAEEASASTEELSAQVEEVVASSSTLKDLASALKDSVSVFMTSSIRTEKVQDSDVEDENEPQNEIAA